jgi:hypothetical protein
MVLSTVVPTSFMAVDSLDKTRFRYIFQLQWVGIFTTGCLERNSPPRPYVWSLATVWSYPDESKC